MWLFLFKLLFLNMQSISVYWKCAFVEMFEPVIIFSHTHRHQLVCLNNYYINTNRSACIVRLKQWHRFVDWPNEALVFPHTLSHTVISLLKYYIKTKRSACIIKLTLWHRFVDWPNGALIFYCTLTHTHRHQFA